MKKWHAEINCVACEKYTENGSIIHHVYHRGAHKDLEMKPWNHMPLCVACHTEIHAKGTTHMSAKYQGVLRWLEANNWIFDSYLGKWRNDGANLS